MRTREPLDPRPRGSRSDLAARRGYYGAMNADRMPSALSLLCELIGGPRKRTPRAPGWIPCSPMLGPIRRFPVIAALSSLILFGAPVETVSGGSSRLHAGDVLCVIDPEGRPAVSDGSEDSQQALHCTCPDSIALFVNSDRVYEGALMWKGAGLEAPWGAFAERYETPSDQPGAVCEVVLQLTDNGNGIRSEIDLYVWHDEKGRPGEVAGTLPGIDLGNLPAWPRYTTRSLEVYEIQRIGVQGAFWVGFRGAWEPDSCSVLVPLDLSGDHPETVRQGMTYVAPGTEYPEGWQSIETIYGQPAALAIGVVVGWCPVPIEQLSWGKIKTLYR
jgi:hypothetical protein